MIKDKLIVVAPSYNESENILEFVEEWGNELKTRQIDFSFIIIDDLSTDKTLELLNSAKNNFPQLILESGVKRGHGLSCLYGYKKALELEAEWILQIDSDLQCDPKYFLTFWRERANHKVIMGNRTIRKDGLIRSAISLILQFQILILTRTYIRDANVPYRLMHRSILTKALEKLPENFYLTNIALSITIKKISTIKWINIIFRKRKGQVGSINLKFFAAHALALLKDLSKI